MDEPRGPIEIYPPGADEPVPEQESRRQLFKRRAKAIGLTLFAIVALVSEFVPVILTALSYTK